MPWRDWLTRQWSHPTLAGSLLLRPPAWAYGALVVARQALYDSGLRKGSRLPVPMIVVGNLVVGGAGKTPAVIALVDWLCAAGWRPGVVSRGYGRQSGTVQVLTLHDSAESVGDEPLLILRRSGAPVAVGADRVAAAQSLLSARPELNILVADDGLQHLRLARDVEVIVVDSRGAGNGHCLPAGPLRAPLPTQPPPQSLLLYSHGAASLAWSGHIGTRQLAGVLPWADWWSGAPPARDSWASLRGRPVVAAAGLARPDAFFDMLRVQGLHVLPCPLPDHHDFATLPWPADSTDVVVTEKDAVKLSPECFGASRVWVAPLDFQLPESFCQALAQRLPELPPTLPPTLPTSP